MTRSDYRWDARDYARHSSQQFQWARELMDKLNLSPEESVLDIGCGDGRVTLPLAEQVPGGRVLGIDSSESMIDLARASLESKPASNVTFEVMDAREIAVNRQYDVAFSNAALHWVREGEQVLEGVARSLRPGGRLLFQMGGKGNAMELIRVLDRLMASETWRESFEGFRFPYGFFSSEDYGSWLETVGLSPQRLELIPREMKHEGAEGLAGWIRTTWLPYTQRVASDRREVFIEEVVSNYLEAHPLDAEGNAVVSMVRLEVEAQKPSSPKTQ